jgi:alpha-beta hydrolase superfamily lysophospholipase
LLVAGCSLPATDPATETIASWAPPVAPRAVIVALHGFNDYRAAFAEFGAHAAANGVLVEAYDQPGFGAHPARGSWAGTPELVGALDEAVLSAARRHPGLPVYVLGESMGAAVAMSAMGAAKPPPVAGLILVAPAVWNGADLPASYLATLRILAGIAPTLRVSGRNLKRQASDNIEMLRALGRDPLVLRDTRLDGVAGLVELMLAGQEAAPGLHLPMLVLLGARDQIVPPQASRRFVATLPAATCSVATYLNGWHLLLRDHQRSNVFADILAWVDGRPLPSRLDHPCGTPPQS